MNKLPKMTLIKSTSSFYKQPKKIGDIIEIDNEKFILIDIQDCKIEEYSKKITITFVGQDFKNMSYKTQSKVDNDYYVTTSVQKPYNDESLNQVLRIGNIHMVNNHAWRIVKIKSIEWIGEEVKVIVKLKQLQPLSVDKVKETQKEFNKSNFKLLK